MPVREPISHMPVWRLMLAAMLLVGGTGLVAWSFTSSRPISGRGDWSQQQALEYQEAAIKLHGLSHEFAQAAERADQESVRRELNTARGDYEVLRGQLETAIARPRYVTLLLRIGGVLLAATGAAIYFWPQSERRNSV